MADGTSKPIKDVRVGDAVWATDPDTGEAGSRRVTDTIVGDGVKQLVDLTIAGKVITATDGHPFWVPAKQAWIDAKDLRPGDLLQHANGASVRIEAINKRETVNRVHNLTVDHIRTYHVLAGDKPVLVHNCGPDLDALAQSGKVPDRNNLTAAGRSLQKHGSRAGSTYPKVPGRDLNTRGQEILEEILTNPNTVVRQYTHKNYGQVTDFRLPNLGARFDSNGKLMGFLSP